MGPHAARQMAMVHGAEARGRYRVCESALTPTHTSSSPRSKTANTAAPSWTAARPYFPPASFLRMASSAALRAFSCSFWATEPCAHKHANPCQRGRARPSEAESRRSAAQVTSSSSSSSSFLPLAFLFTTAFWALLEPPPAPVGCETRVPNHVHQSAGGGSTVMGGSVYHRLSRAQAQSPITFLIKGATQGERAAPRAQRSAARGR